MAMKVTNNSPSIGYISWSNVSISYMGSVYAIANGSTDFIYIYWKYSDPLNFYGSDVFPTLGPDDLLVFLNKNGIHVKVPNTTIIDGSLIVPESILTDALAANVITSEKIATGAITASTVAADAIGATAIAADAIGAGHIAAGAIQAEHISAGAITAGTLAADAVGAGVIAAGVIVGDNLVSGTITATQIAAGTITAASGIIANAAIGTAQIIDGAITTAKIGSAQITTATIADAAITNAKISSLDATKITTGTLNAGRIGANSITSDKISVTSLAAINANLGNITAGSLKSVSIEGATITSTGTNGQVKMTSDYISSQQDIYNAVGYEVKLSKGEVNLYDYNNSLEYNRTQLTPYSLSFYYPAYDVYGNKSYPYSASIATSNLSRTIQLRPYTGGGVEITKGSLAVNEIISYGYDTPAFPNGISGGTASSPAAVNFPNGIQNGAWINAGYGNGWSTYNTAYHPAGYMKTANEMVALRGAIKGGTISSTLGAFQLPVGMRPSKDMTFLGVDYNNNSCAIYVRATGYVCIGSGDNRYISLEGVRFFTS